jgi:predicted pyridoxine 5'-phosphate oxidase superfamily flavin-nucleotide-binding protein
MDTGSAPSSDVAFTPSVKRVQSERGSRRSYARLEERGGWETTVTPELAAFIAERDSLFLATANASGQPYIQHRGGPPGFLRVIDDTTLGFADLAGNKQFITLGNLAENDQAFVFLIDYVAQRRLKLWVRARVANDAATIESLRAPNGTAKADQAIVMHLVAWDENCPQHIPQLMSTEKVEAYLASLHARIAELEAELRKANA